MALVALEDMSLLPDGLASASADAQVALVAVEDLSFTYPTSLRPALRAASFELCVGEFSVLCGTSGCGKTTLLRHLKTALAPSGKRVGTVFFEGRPLGEISAREQACAIGFVLQNPDNQIVTDKVWHELAFGLESLGLPQQTIRLRVAEMASFFGIQEWYHKKVIELSGGQKQLLNLAAVMAMQPRLLVLDEPTSQLDPIAASEFLAALKKVNGELGVTVLLSEHRLEDALPLADRVMVMSGGRVVGLCSAAEAGRLLATRNDPMLCAMPTPMQAALALERASGACHTTAPVSKEASDVYSTTTPVPSGEDIPVSVREGRAWLGRLLSERDAGDREIVEDAGGSHSAHRPLVSSRASEALIFARDVWFRYEKAGDDVLRGLNLCVWPGEFLTLVGGNGTGKSTALGVLSGQLKAYRGKLRIAGLEPGKAGGAALFAKGLTALPQDPQTLFLHNSILEDLVSSLPAQISEAERSARLRWAIGATEIAGIIDRHPYDVSGGEQQRAALAKALLTEPRILFLDEPTKGMDAFYKQKFAAILARLQADGLTILMVSHDVEFCAAHADRCALFFDGGIVTEAAPSVFFSGNSFYTTAANRMSRGLLEDIVTTEDLIRALLTLQRDAQQRDAGRDARREAGQQGVEQDERQQDTQQSERQGVERDAQQQCEWQGAGRQDTL
jgi:energy-coupling factor transport system ATP-binding protein